MQKHKSPNVQLSIINLPQLSQGQFGYNDFPLKYDPSQEVIRSINSKPLADRLPPYGARYYLIKSQEPVKVSFSGSTLAHLTPAEPPTGDYVWYSNRGDKSDFSLTRSFDLTDLDSATLDYRIWYQLDNLYDYAYLEASPDGGRTWEILNTGYGTDSNPRGQALGFGYTGSTNEWLSESINLNPYTGQEIIIRFQLITDFTINRDGVQLDDITIPELGYFDGAEDESGGWDAQGFIRSSNLVPVEWIVWLVKASNPMQVERISLSPAQMAEFEIEGFGEQFNAAAVVISPTAPTTTMELDYELVFQYP